MFRREKCMNKNLRKIRAILVKRIEGIVEPVDKTTTA